jgi:hypothetical protein
MVDVCSLTVKVGRRFQFSTVAARKFGFFPFSDPKCDFTSGKSGAFAATLQAGSSG